MNIVITGTRGLAAALSQVYKDHNVECLSRKDFNIHLVSEWGQQFSNADILFNCAYDNDGQFKILEYFANMWQTDPNKTIITIGSMSADYPRLEKEKNNEFWPYRYYKKTLQEAVKDLRSTCMCDLRIYNPGAIDTDMIKHLDVPKFDVDVLAQQIRKLNEMQGLKRVDLWI